jgi:uncharacterized protein YhbP (UPF0306 family)
VKRRPPAIFNSDFFTSDIFYAYDDIAAAFKAIAKEMKAATRKRREQTSQIAVAGTLPEEAGTNAERKDKKKNMKKTTAKINHKASSGARILIRLLLLI